MNAVHANLYEALHLKLLFLRAVVSISIPRIADHETRTVLTKALEETMPLVDVDTAQTEARLLVAERKEDDRGA